MPSSTIWRSRGGNTTTSGCLMIVLARRLCLMVLQQSAVSDVGVSRHWLTYSHRSSKRSRHRTSYSSCLRTNVRSRVRSYLQQTWVILVTRSASTGCHLCWYHISWASFTIKKLSFIVLYVHSSSKAYPSNCCQSYQF